MPARIITLGYLLSFAVCALAQAPSSDQLNQPHIQQPAPAQRVETPQRITPLPPVGQDVRADLLRMRALLNQMRTNLAFVQDTQTPLKHQFELECDMWQILITDLERQMNAAPNDAAPKESKPPAPR
jgi:hypothetical protein